jgi:hypothetical protein
VGRLVAPMIGAATTGLFRTYAMATVPIDTP